MHEDRFDDKIRELLNKAHEDYDRTSWDELSKKMDLQGEEESSEDPTAFIPIVKEKLDDQRAEVNEEHWETLKTELDYIQERRERLYIVKALEAAIVLLLVFTYFNYKWHTKDIQVNHEYFAEIQESVQDPETISAELVLADSQNETAVIGNIYNTPISSSRKLTSISTKSFSVLSLNSGKLDIAKSNSFSFDLAGSEIDLDPTNENTTLSKLPIESFTIAQPQLEIPSLAMVEDTSDDIEKVSSWTLGIPFSYDVNFVNTDINLGYLSNQIKSGLGGRSIGLTVGYRRHNIEIETGIEYSVKTFVPGQLTNYSESGPNSFIESQLGNMVMHQFQVPLLAKVYASPNRKSSLYAVAGFAVNAITTNNYNISRRVQSKARFETTPLAKIIEFHELPQGLSQGGSLSDNIYMTTILGFGIQSHIANGVYWYFQPQYQHSFTSDINELVTKINSLNIEAGLRFSF